MKNCFGLSGLAMNLIFSNYVFVYLEFLHGFFFLTSMLTLNYTISFFNLNVHCQGPN